MKRIVIGLLCGFLAVGSACRSTDSEAPEPTAEAASEAPAPEVAPEPEATPDLSPAREALESGRVAEAISAARRVAEHDPGSAEALVVLASAYELAGRHEEALVAADRALALAPGTAGALVTRSAALRSLGRSEAAEAAARQALEADPDNRGALWNLARLVEDPTEPLRRLVALAPDDVDARMSLARALAKREEAEEAAEQAEEAAKRRPRDPAIRVFLAGVHYEAGRFGTAMDHAQAALKLDPERGEALELFRAAFYVAVASELRCRHGEGPWSKEQVEPVLQRYREQGLGGTEAFYDYHRELGDEPGVRERVTRAAGDCQAQ